ncbi:MAG: hypothetical protein ACO1OT_03205 [Heyndrickxia sp.]
MEKTMIGGGFFLSKVAQVVLTTWEYINIFKKLEWGVYFEKE